jgi:hypothetical protein
MPPPRDDPALPLFARIVAISKDNHAFRLPLTLQGQSQLELGPPALINNPRFLRRELEEHLNLKSA